MSSKGAKSTRKSNVNEQIPQHKIDFMKFHSENGVRTVTGSIGPVQNGKVMRFDHHPDTVIGSLFSKDVTEGRLSTCLRLPEVCS